VPFEDETPAMGEVLAHFKEIAAQHYGPQEYHSFKLL
jgi:hypothetical protein